MSLVAAIRARLTAAAIAAGVPETAVFQTSEALSRHLTTPRVVIVYRGEPNTANPQDWALSADRAAIRRRVVTRSPEFVVSIDMENEASAERLADALAVNLGQGFVPDAPTSPPEPGETPWRDFIAVTSFRRTPVEDDSVLRGAVALEITIQFEGALWQTQPQNVMTLTQGASE
jgi:hypothetical protein